MIKILQKKEYTSNIVMKKVGDTCSSVET